ncbi:MAG: SgcJ/EcaC family oxidoreductase [Alphaproteobacteria bacterium]|nr:SgcJ/EcaC family oxidoreductase [Alphaproteobacteria bacterium]
MSANELTVLDRRAIKALIDGLAEAWNRHDGTAYAASFTDDADYIAFDGTHVRGRRAIARLHRYLFENALRASRRIFEGNPRLRFLAPDTAVAIIAGAVMMPWQRRSIRRRRSIQTYILVKREGEWRIAAFHTSRVRPLPVSGITFGMAQLVVRVRSAVAKSFH